MSFEAVNRVVEHSKATGVTRMVLLIIASHESEGRGAFPAIHTLAREANAGERTVQDCISRAKALGELAVDYQAGPHGTNVYRTLCGTRESAPLHVAETRESAGVQNPHPEGGGADSRRESAPKRKELGVKPLVVGLASSDSDVVKSAGKPASTRPTEDQTYLAGKLTEAWSVGPKHLGPAAIQRLNTRFGVQAVTSALRSLHGFPPEEAVKSPYAYLVAICAQEVSA
jgi:hypothetical protein